MIVFGMIQSPERNCDSLIVKQISGGEKTSAYAIDLKIKAEFGKCRPSGELCLWRPSGNVLYAETASDGRDHAGRTITVGILLERESAADRAVAPETVGKLFEALALTVTPERAAKLAGAIRPTKKPDIDNCIKIIADALNGLAYVDDTQIVGVTAEKFYAEIPRVEVEITEVLNESLLDHNS